MPFSDPCLHLMIFSTKMICSPFTAEWLENKIFTCAFQFSRKTFSCIFLGLKCFCSALLHSLCTLCFFQKQSANQPKIYRGNVLLLHRKGHAKIQVLLKENKFYPKKVTYIPLAPSHSIAHRAEICKEIYLCDWIDVFTCYNDLGLIGILAGILT